MAKLNMANMNTLFRKGYLLAGIMMASNMFAVNEMKAMDMEEEELTSMPAAMPPIDFDSNSNPNINENNLGFYEKNQDRPIKIHVKDYEKTLLKSIPPSFANLGYLGAIKDGEQKQKNPRVQNFSAVCSLLSLVENAIFFGTLALSGANNYFKWWNYDAGRYWELGCLGYRTKRLLNSILQFEVNLNVGKGILRLISNIIEQRRDMKGKNENASKHNASFWVCGFIISSVSMPLTLHLSKYNFSISISLDAILCKLLIRWTR